MAPDAAPQDADSKPAQEQSAHTEGPPPTAESAAQAMRALWVRIAELRAYAAYFLAAKIDQLKLSIRQVIVLAVLCLLAVAAVMGLIITAIVLLLRGLAGGLAVVCGHNAWLGDLLCGALVLGLIAIGIWIGLKVMRGASRQMTVKKYESFRREQRNNLGQDVRQRARSAADKR